jgi:hypothetical protein
VFPIDWLLIENIKAIDNTILDEETKEKIREHYRKLYREERKTRDIMEKYIKDSASKGKVPTIKMMPDRDNVAEDAHQCFYCTDFAYNSYIRCKEHKIHYCLYH